MKMTIKVLLHNTQLLFFLTCHSSTYQLHIGDCHVILGRIIVKVKKGRAVGGMGHTIVLSQKDMGCTEWSTMLMVLIVPIWKGERTAAAFFSTPLSLLFLFSYLSHSHQVTNISPFLIVSWFFLLFHSLVVLALVFTTTPSLRDRSFWISTKAPLLWINQSFLQLKVCCKVQLQPSIHAVRFITALKNDLSWQQWWMSHVNLYYGLY